MKALSISAAIKLLLSGGPIEAVGDSSRELRFRDVLQPSIRLDAPSESARAISLAYVLLMTDVPTDDEPDYIGGSFWLREWNIWNGNSDRIAVALLEALRHTFGGQDRINEAPVMALDAREFVLAHALLVLSLIFQWDAYYVPGTRRFLVVLSHDGYVDVIASTADIHRRLYDRFSEGGWSPSIPD